MSVDNEGFWEEDDIDYSQRPDLAPPNSTWNPDNSSGDDSHGGWNTTHPSSDNYDPTWGGYVDPNDPNDPHSGWLDDVYDAQGWGTRPTGAPTPPPGTTPPPTPTPTPTPKPTPTPNKPGSVSGPGDYKSSYTPPAFTPSPFIMPNGMVPPGMPFSPDPNAVALQNAALEKAVNTPAVQPFVNPYQAAQDQLMNKFMTEPQYDQNYINMLNEQQKEIALAREGQMRRGILQSAANRGVQSGGQVQAGMRRAGQDTTQNLLEAQRGIATQAHDQNRAGFERALGLSDQLAAGMSERLYRTDTANRSALLDALGLTESIYGGREDRGLNVGRFMETIREYDQDLLNRQAEFSAGSNFGYDQLNSGNRFNYDSLNSMNEREWLNYLARLAGR